MFQYAHDFVISGSQFNNHYVVHSDNSSHEHFVSRSFRPPLFEQLIHICQDKILRRLNGLMAIVLFRSAGHNQCSRAYLREWCDFTLCLVAQYHTLKFTFFTNQH